MPNTVIQLKKSSTPGSSPSSGNLANGELAINFADGVIYYKNLVGQVAQFIAPGRNYGTVNANGTLLVSAIAGDVFTILPGQNITVTGDAVNDRVTIGADLTSANGWANLVGSSANASSSANDATQGANIAVLAAAFVSNSQSLSANVNILAAAISSGGLANTSGVSFNGNLYFPSGKLGIATTNVYNRFQIGRYPSDILGFGYTNPNGIENARASINEGGLYITSKVEDVANTGLTLAVVRNGNVFNGSSYIDWMYLPSGSGQSDTRTSRIKGGQINNGTASPVGWGYLGFETAAPGSTASTERMRIDANGNVGINTSSPAYRLDVNGAIGFNGDIVKTSGDDFRIIVFGRTVIGGGGSGVQTIRSSSGGLNIIHTDTDGTRLFVSDNVGVGTTSPTAKLHVNGTANVANTLIIGLGSASVPSLTFPSYTNYGLYFNTASGVVLTHNGSDTLSTRTGGIAINQSSFLGWASSGVTAGVDVYLYRDAANTLALRNSTSAQTFNIYNTYTDGSNYERGFLKWNSNVLQIGTEAAGTGTARSLEFVTNGTSRWRIDSTGNLIPITNNQFDIGTAANNVSNIYTNAIGFLGAGGISSSTLSGSGFACLKIVFAGSGAIGLVRESTFTGNIIIGKPLNGWPCGVFEFGDNAWTATPNNVILSSTTGSGTNIVGGNLTLRGGVSTGTASGGAVILSVTPAGVISGTARNSSVEVIRVTSTQLVTFGGTTSSFPALKRSSTTLQVRLADDTGDADLQCRTLTAATKSFDIPHPTKSDKRLRYGSLEGPENGVYVRGKIEGKVIDLPDYWTGLVDEDSITVQLTAIGRSQGLYVVEVVDNKVFIDTENHTEPHCYYFIQAERKDVEKLVVEY